MNFRELQCAQRNNIPYKNSLKEWLPETISGRPTAIFNKLNRLMTRVSLFHCIIHAGRRCQLICRAKGQYLVTLLESKAVDGTRCKGNGVCIDGQCHVRHPQSHQNDQKECYSFSRLLAVTTRLIPKWS